MDFIPKDMTHVPIYWDVSVRAVGVKIRMHVLCQLVCGW